MNTPEGSRAMPTGGETSASRRDGRRTWGIFACGRKVAERAETPGIQGRMAMDDLRRILADLATDGTMTALWCAAKATGVLAGAAMMALALRKRAAAARHLIWALGLAGALAVLPLALALPRWRVPVLESPNRSASAAAPAPDPVAVTAERLETVESVIRPSRPMPPAIESSPVERVPPRSPGVAWPLVVWVVGSLAVL